MAGCAAVRGAAATQTWAALAGRTWATYIGDRLNGGHSAIT
jgi:hypothetical protein